MAQVDTGTTANDGTGDPLRDAFIKLNATDQELLAGLSDARDRRVSTIWNENLSTVSFPNGTAAVLQINTAKVSLWGKLGAAPTTPLATDQADADGIWWRKVWDSATATATRIGNFQVAGIPRVTGLAGTPDAITAQVPADGADLGIGNNGIWFAFVPVATNTADAPTLQVGTGPVRVLRDEENKPIKAGHLIPGIMHVVQPTSNGVLTVRGALVRPSDLPAIRTLLNSTAATVTSMNNTVTTLANKKVLEYALQTSTALPARPDAPVVHWLTWTDPTALMQASDFWFKMPAPTVPDMPADSSWRWVNARTGTGGILQILSIPSASPPVTAIEYQLDSGPWTALPAATVGDIAINGLTNGQTYNLALRYRNFVGPGIPTAALPMTVASGPFSDNFNRADQPISNNARWLDVAVGGSNRKMVVASNAAQPVATNEQYVVQVREYFAPAQFIEAQVLAAGANISLNRGAALYVRMPIGKHSGYRLRVAGTVWALERVVDGVVSPLANGTHGGSYPVQARLVAQGNVLTASLGGTVVATVTDSSTAALTMGTVGLGANAAGSDGAAAVRIDNLSAGNV